MIDYAGDVKIYTQRDHPNVMQAMRVSLGAMGIFTYIIMPGFGSMNSSRVLLILR
jgi:hypothetical protein